ncbi:alpha/beta hydrolase [Roseivirga misakiensis]|uniref:BD-FAE-like domain-containing protein n=1 Tax=Roseivirga misakiensis TaxID=1563681 RepID=A0A1E5T0F9_9BACT|nr:alpha/beta hydrolase [Roseivirga misakiensis]OEK04868.1 hypothetical protein BFP71_15630 [Roseivirga misakiensis]
MFRFRRNALLLSLICLSINYSIAQLSVFKDLSYVEDGTGSKHQKLSLVLPENSSETPLLIWIGGGAWSYVDYNLELNFAKKFAETGVAVATVGHRLSPATWRDPDLNKGVQHPAHVNDLASAIKWLYDHATEYGYSQEKIFIGGFSSGGHLAALVDLDRKYLGAQNLPKDLFKGIIPISGAYDITHYHTTFKNGSQPELAIQHVEAVFGSTSEALIDASPMTYLENLSTPMLIISDGTVNRYTEYFEAALDKTSFNEYRFVYARELSHTELWRQMSFSDSSQYRDLITSFIQTQLNKL